MFDFPQPGEIYRSAGFPDVAVVGILEDGIPWEMPYRCPDIVWNPYRRKFSILVRILADGRTTDIPLGRFLREFTCDRPDLFKRSPVNRHAVLKEMAGDPELQNAYSALFDHGLASKSDQRFASIRSTGNLTFSTAF